MRDRFEELKQNYLPRFWDTEKKEMVYPDWNDYSNNIVYYYDKSTENDPCDDWDIMWLSDMLMNERFIRMKPIGIKDKNGNLIYDEDFIFVVNNDTKDNPEKCIGHIWSDEMGCRWVKFKTEELSWNDFCSLIDYDLTLTFEIIGNIHENKELI